MIIGYVLIFANPANAHYTKKPESYKKMDLKQKHRYLIKQKAHASYVVRKGSAYPKYWHRKALKRINRSLNRIHVAMAPKPPHWSYWRLMQIRLAEKIAPFHKDAWPNCPDPYAGGGSWDDTMHCETRGTWESIGVRAWSVDPPGYYRCALQFDPSWERRYNIKVCP